MSSRVELPDFDDLFKLAERISNLSREKAILEIQIKHEEAKITKEATTNEEYFVKGKPPSQAYIDNAWKYTGFDDSILVLREELVILTSKLELLKTELYLWKDVMDIWRTESANERVAVI